MLRQAISVIILLCFTWSPLANAGHMHTYLEGRILKKTPAYWVLENSAGTYWISVRRHPSFTRKISDVATGFWVQMRDIKRFRPNVKRT